MALHPSIFLLAILSAQVSCAAGGTIPAAALSEDDVCRKKGGCALNALQRVPISAHGEVELRTDGSNASSSSLPAQTAITFAGGGYKAMTTYFGTLAGAQGVTARMLECNATLKTVFYNMDGFASNSGGGWFFSQMAFSSKFEDLMAAAAADPSKAGDVWNNGWTTPFMDFAKTGDTSFIFLNIMDTVIEADTRIHESMLQEGVPVRFLSSLIGWTIQGLRLNGQIDDAVHGFLEAVLLPRAPCGCEGMAHSRGLEPRDSCKCMALQELGRVQDVTAILSERPFSPGRLARFFKMTPQILKALGGAVVGLAQNLEEFYKLWQKTGLDWTNVVIAMLTTSGINPNRRLGTDVVNEFAKGKLWVACLSLMTPGGRDKDLEVIGYATRTNKLSYTTSSGTTDDFNLYTPARIAVHMGTGLGASTNKSFCAQEDCFGFYNNWKSSAKIPFVTMKKTARAFAPFLNEGMKYAGTLLLADIVASSSAAVGMMALTPASRFGRALATWVARSIHPYDQAQILLARADGRGDLNFWRTLRDFSHWNVIPLVDGVLSENTGIMNAVATGHTVITANPAFGPMYILKLFSEYMKLSVKERSGANDAFQFGGLPDLTIFADEAVSLLAEIDTWPTLELPEEHKFLTNISTGSVSTVTIANKWAGIVTGVPVKLNIINVMSTIGVQATNSFFAYGTYIQSMVTTIMLESNRAAAEAIVSDFLLGIGGKEKPTACVE